MFKFNFSTEKRSEYSNAVIQNQNNLIWNKSQQIIPSEIVETHNLKTKLVKIGDFKIKYLVGEQVIEELKNTKTATNFVLNVEQNNSDLMPAVYEGGLKIWECTHDLLGFLKDANLQFCDKHVLDLGCGVGLLGIYTCLNGAEVTFQDYNVEVINGVTIPNVRLNIPNEKPCHFYSGDWSSFLELVDKKFDYILTSETIYNTENYSKLTNIFKNLLKKGGTIYLAAKTYYFGVGGNLSDFQNELNHAKILYKTVWECNDAIKRVIIEIKLE